MKNFFLIAVLLLCFTPSFLSAQDEEPRKHQLSLNLLDLKQGNRVDLLYQRHAENTSFRFGVNGNFHSLQSNEENDLILEKDSYNYNLGLRAGWARHKIIKEFDLYGGADAVAALFFDQLVSYQQSSDDDFYVENRALNRIIRPSLSIQPFLGMTYLINSRFSLGLELRSSLGYVFRVSQASRERTLIDLSSNDVQIDNMDTGPIQSHGINLDLVNFYGIWFSVHI